MGETILDGRGNWIAGSPNYIAGVTSDNKLMVDASVSAGSQSYLFGKSGADYYPLLAVSGTDGGILRVDSSVSVTTGSEVYVKGGSIIPYNPVGVGSVTGVITIRAGSIQPYNPIGVGSERIAEWGLVTPITTTGSIISYGIGSIRIAEQGISLGVSGIINQGTSPWVVTGSIINYGIGSIRFAAQGIVPLTVEQDRGGLISSGLTFIGSFTGSNFITPGAGSSLFLKMFTASSPIATRFRLVFSGGTNTYIGTWNVPNSGTVALNFMGAEPSGAVNQPLMINLFNAGSVDITAFGRSSL